MEITAINTAKVVGTKLTNTGCGGEGMAAGGFMEIMQQLLRGVNLDSGSQIANQLKQQLEEEGGELGAMLLSELLATGILMQDLPSILGQDAGIIKEAINPAIEGTGVSSIELINVDTVENLQTKPQEKASFMVELVKADLSQAGKQADSGEGDMILQQSRFHSLVSQAQKQVKTTPKQEKPINIEELQKDVESSKFLVSSFSRQGEVSGVSTEDLTQGFSNLSVLDQAKDGILKNINMGKSEFVLKLKPEGLGEITVKMLETGSKISLSIITSSENTGRLLNGEINALRDALRPYNAEINEIVAGSSQVSSQLTSGQEFTSFARQNMFNQSSSRHSSNRGNSLGEDIFPEEISPISARNTSSLDIHI